MARYPRETPLLRRKHGHRCADPSPLRFAAPPNRDTAHSRDASAPFNGAGGEATGLDKRMKLGKLLAEKTLVVECGWARNAGERQAAAVALAAAIGKEQGAEFEKGAAEDLAEFVAADLIAVEDGD